MKALHFLPFSETILKSSHFLNMIRYHLSELNRLSFLPPVRKERRLDNFLRSFYFLGYDKTIWEFEHFKISLKKIKQNPIEFFSQLNQENPLKRKPIRYYSFLQSTI